MDDMTLGNLEWAARGDEVLVDASDTEFRWGILNRKDAEKLRDWLNEFLATGPGDLNG